MGVTSRRIRRLAPAEPFEPLVGQLCADPVHEREGTVTLVLRGSVDRYTAPILRKHVAMALASAPQQIELDLHRASIAPAGDVVLAEIREDVTRAGVTLTLLNARRK